MNQDRRLPSQFEYFQLLFVALAVCLAFLPAAIQGGWFSDDYILVYGIDAAAPTWSESIRMGGGGTLSVSRLLCYPFIGFVGSLLGPQWSHVLALILHILCGLILYGLLRRLSWPHRTAITSMFLFLVAPWAVQPVVWWTAIVVTVSSILLLLALHAFIKWYSSEGATSWLLASQVLVFASLLFYELWMASFVLFWMVGVFLERCNRSMAGETSSWIELIFRALRRSWPIGLPYVLWGLLFAVVMALAPDVRAPHTTPWRMLVTFFSVHVRTYHWFLDTPWLSSASIGWMGFLTPIGMACLAGMAALVAAHQLKIGQRSSQGNRASKPFAPDLADMILIAWGIFLGSRLVFILQGGVATHTRQSYGAAMGFAIAASWLFWWLWEAHGSRKNLRNVVGSFAVLISVALVTVTSGLALHSARVATAEQQAFEFLSSELASLAPNSTILIVGDATGSRGEMPFYQEGDGNWLAYRLRHVLAGRRVYVLENIPPAGTPVRVSRFGKEEILALDKCIVFRWQGGKLVRALG